jgi:hypothetical protein
VGDVVALLNLRILLEDTESHNEAAFVPPK